VKIIRIRGKKRVKKVGFSTVDEILDDILNTLPLNFQERIKEMTADEFRISQHSNLGMTIRNKYFYRNNAREQLIKSLGDKKEHIFLDGDVFSRIVLKKLYEKITTESKQQP
jgi:RecG-like helicase